MAAAPAGGRKRILKEEDMTKIEFETSEEVDVTPTFDTMGLREDLLRGIYAYGTGRGSELSSRTQTRSPTATPGFYSVEHNVLSQLETLGTSCGLY